MKVFDLQCRQQHGFEGWFGSEGDFLSQSERGLVSCPMCGDAQVSRMPSAPRLNLGAEPRRHAPAERAGDAALAAAPMPGGEEASRLAQLHAAWLRVARHVVENTDDVDERFAREARRMHHGEIESRGIRGRASAEEARELADEGIEVMALPIPAALNGPVQ